MLDLILAEGYSGKAQDGLSLPATYPDAQVCSSTDSCSLCSMHSSCRIRQCRIPTFHCMSGRRQLKSPPQSDFGPLIGWQERYSPGGLSLPARQGRSRYSAFTTINLQHVHSRPSLMKGATRNDRLRRRLTCRLDLSVNHSPLIQCLYAFMGC